MTGMRYQPQGLARLSVANRLVRGLVHSWGLNVRGPIAALDAAGKAHGSFGAGTPGNPSGNSWMVGPSGYYLNYFDGGTGTVDSVALAVGDANGSGSPGGNAFSFIARVRLSALTGSNALYASESGGIEIRINESGKINLLKQQTADMGSSTGAIVAGADFDVGVSYDGATVNFYINGIPAGASSSSQTFSLGRQYFLGYAKGTIPLERVANGGRIYRADVWNRPLSPAEFKAWSDNPWQLFEAPEDDEFVVSGAIPGGLSASIAWTEGGDTVSITGLLTNRIAAAWSEAGDTAALSAVITNRASSSWTEGGDSAAVAGVVTDSGALTWAEQGDTASLVGVVASPAPPPSGNTVALSWAEAGDTAAIVARITNRAALAAIDQGDTWALTAYAALPPVIKLTVRFDVLPRDFRTKITRFSN